MKVLHVIDSLNVGGAEKLCCDILKMLHNSGFTADCLTISDKGVLFAEVEKFTNAICLNRKHKFSFKDLKKCAKIISQYDIVHVHMRHTWVYVKLSSVIFIPSARLIFHDHFGDIKINTRKTFRLNGLFKPRYYIGSSRELVDWARSILRVNINSSFLLENTIVPDFSYSNKYKGDWVMVSNLRRTKNLKFAIILAEEMQRYLIIFGNHDGSEYAEEVMRLCEKSQFVKVVHNESNIQQFLCNFKMGIHTSISESGPLVLVEFLAHGLPFISFDTGEVAQTVKSQLPDFFLSSFIKSHWKEKIEFIENYSENNKEALSLTLKNIYQGNFSTDSYLNKCLNIYKTALTC